MSNGSGKSCVVNVGRKGTEGADIGRDHHFVEILRSSLGAVRRIREWPLALADLVGHAALLDMGEDACHPTDVEELVRGLRLTVVGGEDG
jgi:hypothetical protein